MDSVKQPYICTCTRASSPVSKITILVVPKITDNFPAKNITNVCCTPVNIKLANPSFRVPQKMDVLLVLHTF